MSSYVAPRTRSEANQQDASSPVSDWVCGTSKSSHLFVGSGGCDLACLRKHAEPGKSARRFKTSLRLTGGANISSHRFVQFGGCDLGWSRQSVRPSCGATCLFRHAVSDDIEPLDRRPFGFKRKGFIYCQLSRGESVKVGRDGVLGGCIHGDMPENNPLFDVLVRAKTTWWISPLRPWSNQLTTEAGPAMRSFTWKGDVPVFDKRQSKDRFTRMPEVAVLSCCNASSSGNFTLLKHTKAHKKFASTLPTETSPRCASTVTAFNGATGQPLFKRQRGRLTTVGWSRRQGRMSRHSNSKNCWKSFFLKVKRQPLSISEHVSESRAQLFGISQRLGQSHFLFFDRRPVPFGGSRCIETYSSTTSRSRPRTRGESIRG